MSNSPRQEGFTLVETVIAMAIFSLLFGAIWSTLDGAATQSVFAIEQTSVVDRARASLVRITDELANSGTDSTGTEYCLSHPRNLDTDAEFLIFQPRIGLDDDPASWGPRVDYFLRGSAGENFGNGFDDDGDGLIDERELVRRENGVDGVIADGVQEFRVIRLAGDDSILIRIGVARSVPDSAEPVQFQSTTRIALQNIPQF